MLPAETTGGSGFFFLVPLIVFAPVVGLLVNLAFGRRMSEKLVGTVASLASGTAFVVSLLLAISLGAHPEGATVPFVEWIRIGELHIDWAFRVDTLSVTMMLVVSGVGTLIHIYAAGYMHYDVRYKEDPGSYARFFVYLNLFIAAMMVLVSGDSYLMLFVGWEGVGLCSYLLIGFWYNRNTDGTLGDENAQAGKKAFVVNRIGDFGFLIAMFLVFWFFGSLQFGEVFEQAEHLVEELAPWVIPAIALFMLLGVTGKSAQLPLFVWLPDAMAGPTPVSALIHAATMVTAGVYLITRSAPLFELAPAAQFWVALVGSVTALFAATIAVGQFDIKRVLAYSTISQLGFMVAAVGLGAYVAGMFHLVTHAFFKALLFLGSGSVIVGLERGHHPLEEEHEHGGGHHGDDDPEHEGHGEHAPFDPQDMRNMGGLWRKMRSTFIVYAVGALALSGLPPLAGFWSKDEILADASAENTLFYILLTLAAILTAFYMGRQIWLVFFGAPRTEAAEKAKESPLVITLPLWVLAALSVVGGGFNLPGVHTLTDWLEHTLGHAVHVSEFNPTVAIISTVLALASIFVSWLIYGRRKPLKVGGEDPLQRTAFRPIFIGMYNKWWVDELYHFLVVQPYIWLAGFLAQKVDWDFWHDTIHDSILVSGFRTTARILAEPIDLGVIDGIANGLGEVAKSGNELLSRLQTGFVRTYALTVFLGVVVILGYLILR